MTSTLLVCGGRLCSQSLQTIKKEKENGLIKEVKTLRRKVVHFTLTFFLALHRTCAIYESDSCSAWLASPMREKHTWHFKLKDRGEGCMFLIKETLISTIRTKMRRILTSYHKSVTQSPSSRASETQQNSAHARQVTSHNSGHSDTDNISYPYKGVRGVHWWAHSQVSKRKKWRKRYKDHQKPPS